MRGFHRRLQSSHQEEEGYLEPILIVNRERGADSAEMVSSVQEEESEAEAEQKMERGLSSL